MNYKKLLIGMIEQCLHKLKTEDLESLYKQYYSLNVGLITVNIRGTFVLVHDDSYDWQIIDDRLYYKTPRYNIDGITLAAFYPSQTAQECWDKRFEKDIKHMQSLSE